jgi:hypothetical protein
MIKPTSPSLNALRHGWLRLLSAAVITLAAADTAQAAVVLPNVPNGTQYRIVFITSGSYQSYNTTTPAQTRSLSYWDGIVNAEADLSSSTTVQGGTFHVVGSVFDGSTSHNGPVVAGMNLADNIPVYNTQGQLVAANSADFWSANHAGAMNTDRDGATLNANYYNAWIPTLPTFRPFGHGVQTFWSNSGTNVAPWAVGNTLGSTSFLRVAAISEPLTAVPEPGTAMLGGIALLGLLQRRRRC